MANLKELRNQIASVQSTKRITSAMKMVAAAKLRKAQQRAQSATPYAARMERILRALAAEGGDDAPPLLTGTKRDDVHLLVLISSDRGLCGGFNGAVAREIRREIARLRHEQKTVQLMIVGRKGVTMLRRDHGDKILDTFEELSKPEPGYDGARRVSDRILALFEAGGFDVCTLFYNRFVSALSQEVTALRLIPFEGSITGDKSARDEDGAIQDRAPAIAAAAQYEYEPSEEAILHSLAPKNLMVQVFRGLLESFASEQSARMTAMDNATRNASDMIGKLSVTYNRSRQAQITKELIEIISGAEAL